MSEGFSDPVTAGDDLVIPAIQSPNFVSGVSGWAVFRDGSAQFNDVTVTGGTVTGTDGILSPAGTFWYSGPPAPGNLIFSIAPLATSADGFGNAVQGGGAAAYNANGTVELFPAGLIFSDPAAGITTVVQMQAGQVQVNSQGTGESTWTFNVAVTFTEAVTPSLPLAAQASAPAAAAATGQFYANANGTPAAETPAGYAGGVPITGADATPKTVTTATAPAALSRVWPVPAGDAQTLTAYRLTACGTATWGSTQQTLTFSLSAFGVANFAALPIGATEFTASLSLQWRLVADVVVVAPGNPGTIKGGISLEMGVAGANQLTQVNTNQSAGGFASHNGANATAVTTTGQNVTLQAVWGSTTGAPTITCDYSYFERLGAL